MNVQRFNDLFFRLIDLYRELTNDLRIIGNEKDKACKGKDSFDYWRNSVYKKINPTQDFNRINKQIIEDYQNFYDLNRNSLGAYFRVLYRLLELIDTSDISTKEKRDYGKILRAQLYESELFVLFYNSQIEKGEKLGKYLWKYHILKHLPIYETIEFKVLYGNLEEQEKEWIDKVYSKILILTKEIVRDFNGKRIEKKVEDPIGIAYKLVCYPLKNQTNKTCNVELSITLEQKINFSNCPNLKVYTDANWKSLFGRMLNVVNVFSKHTSFIYSHSQVRRKVVKYALFFSVISISQKK